MAALQQAEACGGNEFVPGWTLYFGPCSGNGMCVNGTCVCNAGWTGRSDFINADGLDCHIHITSIRVLWVLCFLFVNWLWKCCIAKVRLRWEQHKEMQERRKRTKGQSFPWYRNASLMSVFSYFSLCALGFELYALMKIFDFDDTERVGLTPLATIFFFMTVVGFYLAFFFFQPPLMSVLLRGGTNYVTLTRINYGIALGNLVIEVISTALAFVVLGEGATPTEGALRAFLALFGLNIVCLFAYCVQAFATLRRSNKLLAISYSLHGESWILEIKKNIAHVQKQTIAECFAQGLIYLAIIAWPFLWRNHDYFLPVSWAFATVLWYRIFDAVVESNAGNQSTPDIEPGRAPSSSFAALSTQYGGVGGGGQYPRAKTSMAPVPSESPQSDIASLTLMDPTGNGSVSALSR